MVEREQVLGRERGVEARVETERRNRGTLHGPLQPGQAQEFRKLSRSPQPSASWRPHHPQTPALGLESRSKASLRGSLAWGCKGTALSGAQQGTIYDHTQRTWEGHCCLLGRQLYLRAAPPLGSQDTAWKRGTLSAPDTQERLQLCKARGPGSTSRHLLGSRICLYAGFRGLGDSMALGNR